MQSARPRSPNRGLIEGTSYSIQAPILANNFPTNLVQRREDTTKKQNSHQSTQGMGSGLEYPYTMVSDNSISAQVQSHISDYSAYNLAMGGTSMPSKVTVLKRNAQEAGLLQPSGDDSSESDEEQSAKPALKPGKKTKGRVKIKMEFIKNKLRRYTTFSKRKTGIMKKAYELSTLTGTQVMLLVASETGHVYTFATRKLQPMITSDSGKALIQTCLNSPDLPPAASQNDQRMNPTGYEETELNYAVSEEEMKMALEPSMALVRSHSPPSDNDDSATRRPALAPHHVTQNQNRSVRPDHYRNLVPKDKRPQLHARPRQLGQPQQRPPAAVASTTSIPSNGAAAIPLQVSSALQMGMSVEGVQTDALGQPYLTIPLPAVTQQLILAGQRLPGQTGERVSSHSVRVASHDKALDATKRQDRNTH